MYRNRGKRDVNREAAAPMNPVAVGLGSNLGNREVLLRQAIVGLRSVLQGIVASPVYETEPCYVENQPRFLNACCTGQTQLTPRQMLSALQDIERSLGRRRSPGPRFGARRIDLDLLLYGRRVIDEPDFQVPHPRLTERAFVLFPLADIAPDWPVPLVSGGEGPTIAELAAALPTIRSTMDVKRTDIELQR